MTLTAFERMTIQRTLENVKLCQFQEKSATVKTIAAVTETFFNPIDFARIRLMGGIWKDPMTAVSDVEALKFFLM